LLCHHELVCLGLHGTEEARVLLPEMVGQKMDSIAGNDQGYFKQVVNFTREVTQKVEGDDDGDGRLSLAERYDADGDGKISMAEYAATTNLPNGSTHPEQHAAASVGATQEVRMGWAKLREARQAGVFVPTVAARVLDGTDAMRYNATRGGWTGSTPKWQGPGPSATAPGVGNRNVRAKGPNPFEVRQTFADVADQARKQQLRQYFEQQFAGRPTAGTPPPP